MSRRSRSTSTRIRILGPKTEEKSNQVKGIQCHGCEGFGHIRSECPTYIKKQKKGLFVAWSEDDSESDPEEDFSKQFTALTGIYDSDEESNGEDLTFEELFASYKELFLMSEEVCQLREKQKRTSAQLQAEKWSICLSFWKVWSYKTLFLQIIWLFQTCNTTQERTDQCKNKEDVDSQN